MKSSGGEGGRGREDSKEEWRSIKNSGGQEGQ